MILLQHPLTLWGGNDPEGSCEEGRECLVRGGTSALGVN